MPQLGAVPVTGTLATAPGRELLQLIVAVYWLIDDTLPGSIASVTEYAPARSGKVTGPVLALVPAPAVAALPSTVPGVCTTDTRNWSAAFARDATVLVTATVAGRAVLVMVQLIWSSSAGVSVQLPAALRPDGSTVGEPAVLLLQAMLALNWLKACVLPGCSTSDSVTTVPAVTSWLPVLVLALAAPLPTPVLALATVPLFCTMLISKPLVPATGRDATVLARLMLATSSVMVSVFSTRPGLPQLLVLASR